MKQLERDLDLISMIIHDSEVVSKRIHRFDLTEEKFVYDRSEDGELAYDAVMSPIYRIAEDAIHLSDAVSRAYPEYPWKQIRGFRNFVAHGYREVDRRIAWKVASEDIPALVEGLKSYWNDHAAGLADEIDGCMPAEID